MPTIVSNIPRILVTIPIVIPAIATATIFPLLFLDIIANTIASTPEIIARYVQHKQGMEKIPMQKDAIAKASV